MNAGERRALRHYRLRGWSLVDANVRGGRYELDLVLRRGRTIAFVEVKERSGTAFGGAVGAVGREKRRRVRRAAAAWLARHPELVDVDVVLEVAAVHGGRVERFGFPLEDDAYD